MDEQELLSAFDSIGVWERKGERAIYKPIMLLYALAKFQKGVEDLDYSNIRDEIRSILEYFWPSKKIIRPDYPFWYLKTPIQVNTENKVSIWEVRSMQGLEYRKGKLGKEPREPSLRKCKTKAGFTYEVIHLLKDNNQLVVRLANLLLDAHFPESLHEDAASLTGLDMHETYGILRTKRDPKFREKIMIAYGYRCAICSYGLRLNDKTVGLEAAHIKWHQAEGPDNEKNGVSLCCIHHKLFDLGAFTIDSEFRVEVSEKVHSDINDEVIIRYNLGGINLPRNKEHFPDASFLDWHRSYVFAGN